MKYATILRSTGFVLGALSSVGVLVSSANAADHQEAPGSTALLSADIGDYYAWHAEENLNLILTFGTFAAAGSDGSYDSNIIYGFHFDTSVPADGTADLDIYARFGQDNSGNWGIQLSGIGDSALQGAVETTLSNASITAWAGVADDPFFFDQTGFRETLATGTLSFNPERDDVAGLNVTAIAIQVPISAVQANGSELQTWVTTGTL